MACHPSSALKRSDGLPYDVISPWPAVYVMDLGYGLMADRGVFGNYLVLSASPTSALYITQTRNQTEAISVFYEILAIKVNELNLGETRRQTDCPRRQSYRLPRSAHGGVLEGGLSDTTRCV